MSYLSGFASAVGRSLSPSGFNNASQTFAPPKPSPTSQTVGGAAGGLIPPISSTSSGGTAGSPYAVPYRQNIVDYKQQLVQHYQNPFDSVQAYGQAAEQSGLKDTQSRTFGLQRSLSDIEGKIANVTPDTTNAAKGFLVDQNSLGKQIAGNELPLRTQYAQLSSQMGPLQNELSQKDKLASLLMSNKERAYTDQGAVLSHLSALQSSELALARAQGAGGGGGGGTYAPIDVSGMIGSTAGAVPNTTRPALSSFGSGTSSRPPLSTFHSTL